MKTFGLSILISLLLLVSFLSAQTFQAGIRLNDERPSTGARTFIQPSPLFSSFDITGSAFLGNDFAFEARLGYNWQDHYSGIETGIYSKYYYKDLYAIGGIAYHHINKEDISDDISRNYFPQEANLFMPALGLGFNPGRHFAVELMFLQGFNQKLGYRHSQAYEPNHFPSFSEEFPDVNFKWVVKFGISYNFSF